MTVLRSNVEATKAFIRARVGNPYVYGGALSNNVRQGTDCSEVWQTVLEMVLGRWRQGRQSEGATTESYRYIPVGGVGPFGTIRVANWRDIPGNAVARLAFHHGPGGGANSHMWGDLDGMRIESAGSKGLVTGGNARAIEDGYAHAWCYLPGPIDGGGAVPVESTEDLQRRLNTEGAGLEVDGEYGPLTASALAAYDKRVPYARQVKAEGERRGITPRGIQIAFSVVFVESGWKMYANSKVPESLKLPHDAVGSDHDSVGLFQQRCPMWGPANVLMDPTKSAGLFYDRLAKLDYNNQSRPPGDYAADVQRPAAQYRGRYQERMGHAVALYNRITTTPEPSDDLEALLMSDELFASRSIYRTSDQKTMSARDAIFGADACAHMTWIEQKALAGDSWAIGLVADLATGKLPASKDPWAVDRARHIISIIQNAIAAQETK